MNKKRFPYFFSNLVFYTNLQFMSLFKKIKPSNLLMLLLCALIICVAEYLFLRGDKFHAIFVGLWAPTLLGLLIFIKQITNER